MNISSFELVITATVRQGDAPLDDVVAFFQDSEMRPYRHFDETISYVTVTLGFDNRPKIDIEGYVTMRIGYHHEADLMADDASLTSFCEACPDCDIEITSAVLLRADTPSSPLLVPTAT